jgi:tetrahydromethanopterin:alpha-L-glutamate ligase
VNQCIAIFTDDPGWHGARLALEFAARGCDAQFVSLKNCHFDMAGDGAALQLPVFGSLLPDAAFVRGVPGGSLEQIVFYLDVLHALTEMGVPVYNEPRAIERSVDKGMTSFLLRRAGISTPPTWITGDCERARSLAMRELAAGHELVCKPLFGAQGVGLVRVRAGDSLPPIETYRGIYYLQRYVDTSEGSWHDWRVFVIGGRAVAAMRRNGSTWINNVATGGRCQPAVLDDTLRDLAEAAVAAVGMNYGGVDIIRDALGQAWVVEVNSIPAWKGLQGTCNVNVAGMLVDDFLRYSKAGTVAEVAR